MKRVGNVLLKRLRCRVLVITRGEEGMALFEPNQDPYLVPTVAQEVYDVTGAGDTVIGAMALSMAAGAGVKEAADWQTMRQGSSSEKWERQPSLRKN